MTDDDTIPYSILPTLPPDVPKQAILSGTNYLTSSGLTLSVAAGLSVSIGQGETDTIVTFDEPATVGTLPANSTRYIYVKPDKSFVISSTPYCVVDGVTRNYNTSVDRTIKLFGVNGGLGATASVTTDRKQLKGTANGTWGLATLARSSSARYGYFEGTVSRSSQQYCQMGVSWVSASINTSSAKANSQESALSSGVYLALNTTNAASPALLGSPAGWTLHDTSVVDYAAPTIVSWLIDYVDYKVYLAINGVWRNSGNPIASYSGTPPAGATLQYCVSYYETTISTGKYTINDPRLYTNLPVIETDYIHHDKSSNTTYTINNTIETVAPMMYLGSVTTNATTVTATSLYPLNNTYSINANYATGVTTEFTHNLATFNPNVAIQLTTEDEVLLQFKDNNTLKVTTNKAVTIPITVTT